MRKASVATSTSETDPAVGANSSIFSKIIIPFNSIERILAFFTLTAPSNFGA